MGQRGGGDGEGQLEGGDWRGGNGKGETGGGKRGGGEGARRGGILPMDIMECLGGYVYRIELQANRPGATAAMAFTDSYKHM